MKINLTKVSQILVLFGVLFINNLHSQGFTNLNEKDKDSILKIDFIEMEYEYLDKKFRIFADDIKDSNLKQKLSISNTYKDSLDVILSYNLKNTYAEYIAFHRILKSWENVGFYIHKSSIETQNLAKTIGIEHPYKFYELLISEKNNKLKDDIINEVLLILCNKYNIDTEFENNKQILYEAFKLNPNRIKAKNEYLKKNSNHKH